MEDRKFKLHDGKKGAALAIRITPRAMQNKVVDILSDGTVKVHITADPSDLRTNDILLSFLSQELNVSKNRLEIVGGDTGRDKLVSFLDMEAEALHEKILELIKGD
jgi:uncharacterized protein YggU (UPF0235/DUF167 family)